MASQATRIMAYDIWGAKAKGKRGKILSRLTPFLLVWGGRKEGLGGGGSHFGLEAQSLHVTVRTLDPRTRSV
jgi:hypothetical protein